MKKSAFWTVILLFPCSIAYACTTFLLSRDGKFVFGRNYDWITPNGHISTNLRGLVKTSFPQTGGKQITWTSQYGSITFNQYGKEFPTGGMNERGLVVELMWLEGTRYPAADERPAIGVLQWIQYQLDNSATVDDVINSDQVIRITAGGTPLHYLVADAGGQAATIEFLNGKMVVHRGKDLPFPVLTNNRYDESLSLVKPANQEAEASYRDNSLERFIKACNLLDQYRRVPGTAAPVDYAFDILAEVAQGPSTQWSIVYDISAREIHFKTRDYRQVKKVSFGDFDLSCTGKPLLSDMNQEPGGNIRAEFQEFSFERNRQLVERSAEESISQISFSSEAIRKNWEYAGSVRCR